jgi:Arginine dihydrolase ArgZ-like, C-terminal, Rossmann fold/LOR/SDH bifunctional enzyme conserved region
VETPSGEFLKAGGSAKRLALRLTEPVPPGTKGFTSVRSGRVRLEGHLLAAGLLDRALDTIADGGGSFRVLRFELGKQRQSTSQAEVVVVAGPVVVHTGGAAHLAALVREGYVQALLGGNGLATHDIEQALLGTSLGVDSKSGGRAPPSFAGHQHGARLREHCPSGGARRFDAGHLLRMCAAGCSICPGWIHSRRRSAAGHHDGPGQSSGRVCPPVDRHRHDSDAGLHASCDWRGQHDSRRGVKLVCVDINPAVVTKLNDRGSVESVGVVTDLGSFLNLLARRLHGLENPSATRPAPETVAKARVS